MKFSCDRCDAQYMISDEKVGPKGVRVRCKKCGNVISVRRPLENGAAAEERPAATAGAGVGAATQGNLDAELGQAFDHAFGGEPASTPAMPAPLSAAAEAAKADAAVSEPGALQLPAGDELPAFAVAAQPSRTPAPAAPPPATEWYVAIGQAQVGPLPLEEVRRKWEGADVGPDSLVWRPGMGDWAPLSSVADLAAYLAPFPVAPRQSRTPAPAASQHQASASSSPAATPLPGGEVVWRPVGASALAALASEEIATRSTPEPRAERAGVSGGGVRSLVEKMDLPDGGGVDPTGAIPLPMKALDTTGEHKMERVSSVARGAEEIRHKRSAARGIAIAVVALLLIGGAAAAWLLKGRMPSAPAPSAPVAAGPVAAPVPEPTPVKPEPAAAVLAAPAPATPAPATAEAAKPEAAQPEAPKAEPAAPQAVAAAPAPVAPAAEPARAAPAPAREAPAPTTRAARREALRKERLAQAAAAKEAAARSAATAAPAPAPEQPKRRRDVLDFESNDAALEAALGSGKQAASSRSVYVPPPPSGTTLQERVTDSQVNETILGRVSALQQCVQEQKARDAEGTGVLKMRWSIAPDGSVRDPKCVTSEFTSSPIAQCLSGVLKATRFPKSKMGRQDVTFPIKF